ncbi:glutathione S-transferase family protein, partial [Acinetobacter baumannii]
APVITDGGLALAETGAIVDYIVAKHGNGRLTLPVDHPAFADFLYWYHVGNGSLMPAMMMLMGDGEMVSIMRQRVDRNLAALESRLAEGYVWLA